MLIWSRKGRAAAGALAVTLFAGVFLLPLAVILLSSLSKQWNGLLPTGFTFAHFVNAFRGAAVGFAVFEPDGGLLRQPAGAAVRDVGGAGAAPVWRDATEISWPGVLSAQRHPLGFRRAGHSGGV